MISEDIKIRLSNAGLGLAWKIGMRPEYSTATLRKNAERFWGVPAQTLSKKYPNVRIEPLQFGNVAAESIQTITNPKKTILYLHGGGYFMGSIHVYRRIAMRIAHHCKSRVILPQYRLAPEYPYPNALTDAKSVYKSLLDEVSTEKLLIAGDSAGGGLTLATTLSLRDEGLPLPSKVISISPWTDLLGTGDSMQSNRSKDVCLSKRHLVAWAPWYYGSHDPKSPYVSPVYGNFKGFPPMLLFVGEHEIILDDSLRVAKSAESAGVSVKVHLGKEMQHVWFLALPWLKQSKEAMQLLAQFVLAS